MDRSTSFNLNYVLHKEGLKVKHLSATNYVSLIGLKRSLQKYLNEMGEEEKILFKDHGLKEDATQEQVDDILKDINIKEKLKVIQSKNFEPKELNFIPIEEFKKFTDDVDFIVGSTLAEYLLKEEK